MANINSFGAVYNLPKMVVSDTNEHAVLVPNVNTTVSGLAWAKPYYVSAFTSAGNIYPGFPSPQLPNDSGLTVGFPPDVLGQLSVDGHPYKLKLSGVVANPGAGNVTVKLYQVPFASLGVISAAGSVNSAGAPGTGDTLFATLTFTAPANPSHFWAEAILLWDSSTNRLDGYTIGQVQATVLAQTATTAITSGVTAVNAFNFLVSYTFATANATNGVTMQEFGLERY